MDKKEDYGRKRKRDESSYNHYLNNGYYSYAATAKKIDHSDLRRQNAQSSSKTGSMRTTSHHATLKTKKKQNNKASSVKKTHSSKKRKKVKQSIYETAFAKQKSASFLTYALVIVIFVGSISCLVAFAVKSSNKLELEYVERELRDINDDNIVLKAELDDSYDLAEFERIAVTELGMIRPADHQKIRIKLPKQASVVQYDVVDEKYEEYKFDMMAMLELFFSGNTSGND